MSALSPRRRSALRAVVTSAALAGAVLAPAAAAFADAPAVPGAPAAPAAPAAKAAEPGTATVPAPKVSAEGDRKQDRQSQSDKKTEPSSFTLVDGHRMAVGKDRLDNFRGELAVDGHLVLILSSKGNSVGYWGGMRVVLNADGTVESSWAEGAKGEEPVSYALVDGHRMAVGKDRLDNFRGELAVDGHLVLILSSKGNSVGQWGGMRVVLNADGTVESSWIGGGKGGGSKGNSAAAATRGQSTGTSVQAVSAAAAQTKAIPAGGVAAGAEGVGEQGGDHQVLLASGGALASVGAAGIGFAVLYRRRKAVGANA
ncbi:hypothetical protein ACWD4B_33105 [Streptomyces sp. NPDC002536]